MPSVLLLIAAVAMGIASVRARNRCLALVSAGSLLLANPMEMIHSQRSPGGWSVIEWSFATAAPIAGSVLMVAAACLALRPGGRKLQAASRQPGARAATAHVLLRLFTVLLFSSLAVAVITVAPSLLEAAPEVLSYAAGVAMLLVVWALWPMLGGWEAAPGNPA